MVAVQVIGHLNRPAEALSESKRVMGTRSGLLVLAANWDTAF